MTPTPEYTKRAVNNYRNKFDVIQLRMPKGTRERIEAKTSETLNIYVNRLIVEDLERKEAKTDPQNADSLPDFMKD